MDSELLQGFLAQSENSLPTIRSGILVCAQSGNVYGELNASLRQTTALKDAAEIIFLDEIARIAGQLEEKLKFYASLTSPLTDTQSRELLDKLTELEAAVAQMRFNSEDFSAQIADFVEESFFNLGLNEPKLEETEESDEWEEEFEIDEEMLEIFGEEAEELIQNIRANLKKLEKNSDDREALLEVRRSAHTLKGSAGIVGLKVLSEVAHRVEDLLDYLAENEIAGNEKIFELLLVSTDCFGSLASNNNPSQMSKKIDQLYKNFDALMLALKNGETGIAEAELAEQIIASSCGVSANSEPPKKSQEPAANSEKAASEDLKTRVENIKPSAPSDSVAPKSIVRVSLDKLNDLVKIMSGLVISRSIFEQRLAELEHQMGDLHNSTRRLRQSTAKLETNFEADMLNNANRQFSFAEQSFYQPARPANRLQNSLAEPPSNDDEQKVFDTLELDRYTEFHQTMRELIETTGDTSAINSELDNLKDNLETLFENQRKLLEEMQDKLLRLRMVYFGSLSMRLQRTVRVTGDEQGKSAELIIEGESLEIDTQILDALIEPLLHLLRNAVAHGIEPPETRRLLGKSEVGRIKVRAHDEGTHFILTVSDDGRGISAASLKAKAVQHGLMSEAAAEQMSEQEAFALIFHAGLTTAEEISQVSGRGVGMNIVKNAVARQQGTISIESEAHKGTIFTIRLPMALSATRALLVKAAGTTFAFPLKLVKHISQLSTFGSLVSGHWREALVNCQKNSLIIGETPLKEQNNSPILHLNELLGMPVNTIPVNDDTPLLLLKPADYPCCLLVDEIIKPEEIIIKSLGNPLQNLPGLLGATILGDGSVVPVLDLLYLLKSKLETSKSKLENAEETAANDKSNSLIAAQKPLTVLIVDDSPSVRHLTSNIIKNANWKPLVAKDGLEALDVLQELRELPDVILSDVEMPRMNGYELLASLKKQENLRSIPVVMITSRANQKHQQKAIDLGVSEYLTKPFDDANLIQIIKNLAV